MREHERNTAPECEDCYWKDCRWYGIMVPCRVYEIPWPEREDEPCPAHLVRNSDEVAILASEMKEYREE